MRSGSEALRPALALIAGLAVLFAGIEVVLLIEAGFEPAWLLVAFPLGGLIYVATGLFAWARRPHNRIGAIIVAAGFWWFVSGLEGTAVPALIAVGLIVATVLLAFVEYLLLAFPSGRLRDRRDRIVVASAFFVCTVLQVPVFAFREGPSSVLRIADNHELWLLGSWIQIVAGVATVVATALILLGRLRRADPAKRRVLAPLYLYGIFTLVAIPASARIIGTWFPEEGLTLTAIQVAVLMAIPVAFVAAVMRGGFARTGEIEELGARLVAAEDRSALQSALRQALGDPSLELWFWLSEPGSYVDGEGGAVTPPAAGSERALAAVEIGQRRVGAIVYDTSLVTDPELVAAAGRVIALALDRESLTAELLVSRERLRVSRARLVEATDAERRRIARDLHDGLQTRLVLLAMLAGRAREDEAAAAELADGLQVAIAELRELVQGVVPAALTERGLCAAAEDLSDRMPIPVSLAFDGDTGTLPARVETAGWFVVSEAFSNAVKHAGAGELRLSIGRRNGSLRIEVADDGVGGADFRGGGLSGLADRIDALDGNLSVVSPPGGGTRIVAEVPCG